MGGTGSRKSLVPYSAVSPKIGGEKQINIGTIRYKQTANDQVHLGPPNLNGGDSMSLAP